MYNIETNDIYLRRFKLSDLNDLYEYSSLKEVSMLSGFSLQKNKVDALRVLKNFIFSNTIFAIIDKKTDKQIGSVSIRLPEKYYQARHRSISLGFVLNPLFQNKGIMSNLLKELEVSLKNNFDYIYLAHFEYNDACKHLVTKLNYVYYMTDEVYIFSQEKMVNVMFYYKTLD